MPPNARGDITAPKTGPSTGTRKRNGSVTTPEELQEIKNATESRKYLEKYSYLCPPGEPTSNAALAYCLHQISTLAGIPKHAVNAIRSAAFLLEDLQEIAINETIRSAFDSQITEFTSDMKLLVEDVNIKIDERIKEAIEQAIENGKVIQTAAHQDTQTQPENLSTRVSTTYATALINPPPHVNPKLAAREGIRARQFLISGIGESAFGQYDTQKLKAELNKITGEIGLKEGKIRSLTKQKDGNTLVEVDSDIAAKWYANAINRVELCTTLGEDVTFKTRTFNVLALNSPLNIEPEEQKHLDEIHEVNDLENNTISAIRWAKPIVRRSSQQRSAHLALTFTNPTAANRAIANGIVLCGKKESRKSR